MKKTTFLIVTIALLGNLIVSHAQSAELKVKIDKVKHDKGMVYAQIFQGADNYKNGKPLSSSETIAKAGIMHLTFSNLDVGQYAVRIYHDENGNGKLDTNPFGIPTEAYAFSNSALSNFGPPSYKDMEITISGKDDQVTTTAKMQQAYILPDKS